MNWPTRLEQKNSLCVSLDKKKKKIWIKDRVWQDIVASTIHIFSFCQQWFGNLVTMNWWNNIWLNEGFATYMSFLAADSVEPTFKIVSSLQSFSAHIRLMRILFWVVTNALLVFSSLFRSKALESTHEGKAWCICYITWVMQHVVLSVFVFHRKNCPSYLTSTQHLSKILWSHPTL